MATKVVVPRLGEGVEEVTVTKWLKQEGDSVKELEPLLEVNTDKVDTEVPAPASGTVLKIVAQEGVPARVGAILAFIGKPGESLEGAATVAATGVEETTARAAETTPTEMAADHQQSTANPQPATANRQPSTINRESGFISPVVARIAAEQGVDLTQVQGTGLNGRITKNDVLSFVEGKKQDGRAPAVQPPPPPVPAGGGDRLVKHTTIRRQIAEHMVMSQKTSPHVLTVMDADMSRVSAHREANKEQYARDGVKLTYTAYFIAAIVAGLKAYPMVNATWTEEGVLMHSAVNVGMAASLGDEGLIVPVIKGADNLSLLATARAVNDLANRARARKLQPDDVRGGTFTLTNHGIAGSLFAMPIINQPQTAILGTGALQKRVVVVSDANGNDAFAIRPMVYLSLVFDHRILDGASADTFLSKVKSTLENWA
ncbi:MAG TPA: dihydrolipoamide acetyltransferase family protein [Anaerolineales bacterium]|nr:dihydrolipoamide acetyltransferase family protein [Anaerolineales bacterium]